MTNNQRSLHYDLGIVLVGILWLLAPLGLLYLIGWYVDDSLAAASLIHWASICYGVVAALFFALIAWFFLTMKDSLSFAEASCVSLSFGMVLPLFLLSLVVVIALLEKWFVQSFNMAGL